MASSSSLRSHVVSLDEKDIPGASLPRETPEECNCQQLKRWLVCRGALSSGKKAQLVTRVKDYITSGLAKRNLRDPDGGIHLARKKLELGLLDIVEPDLKDTFPSEGYSETLHGLPVVNFKTIWSYMITCVDAKRQLSTAKPMVKGFNFYKSGHVLSVKSHHKNALSYIKSQVLPSMKKTSAYSCYISIRDNGLIRRVFCGCPAGVDGRCNHVAATLFSLEEYCKARLTREQLNESCTSNACRWNVPRKRKGDVAPITQMKFQKHEYGKIKIERSPLVPASKDVRAPHQRGTSSTKLYNILSKVNDFQNRTGKVLGMSHVLQSKTPEQLKAIVESDHCYCKLPPAVLPEHLPHTTPSKESDTLISPIKVHPVSAQEVVDRCERIKKKLNISEEEIQQIESSTRNQSSDLTWHLVRKCRITASKSYRCAVLREHTSPTKAIEDVLSYKKVNQTFAITEGLSQEKEVIKDYLSEKTKNGNSQVTVEPCGFFVSKTHGHLGATPDGLVSDLQSPQPSGLLEVKYVQTSEDETPHEALLRKRICILDNETLTMNKSHQYYYQLQHQMFVTSKHWTDFVVKCSNGGPLFIERVPFNKEFWDSVLPKLDKFFQCHLLPEIAYPRVKYGLTRMCFNYFLCN